MKLVFTDEAKADLLYIGERIATDNPVRAFMSCSKRPICVMLCET